MERGDYSLVYFTPELLLDSHKWRGLILKKHYAERLKDLVVDEAHCVKNYYLDIIKSHLL